MSNQRKKNQNKKTQYFPPGPPGTSSPHRGPHETQGGPLIPPPPLSMDTAVHRVITAAIESDPAITFPVDTPLVWVILTDVLPNPAAHEVRVWCVNLQHEVTLPLHLFPQEQMHPPLWLQCAVTPRTPSGVVQAVLQVREASGVVYPHMDAMVLRYEETIQSSLAHFPPQHPRVIEVMTRLRQLRTIRSEIHDFLSQPRVGVNRPVASPFDVTMLFPPADNETTTFMIHRVQTVLDEHWGALQAHGPGSVQVVLLSAEKEVQKRLMSARSLSVMFVDYDPALTPVGTFLRFAPEWTNIFGQVYFRLGIPRTEVPFTEYLPEIRVGQWVSLRSHKPNSQAMRFQVRSIEAHTMTLRCTDPILYIEAHQDERMTYRKLYDAGFHSANCFHVTFVFNSWPLDTMSRAVQDPRARRFAEQFQNGNNGRMMEGEQQHTTAAQFRGGESLLNHEQQKAIDAILKKPSVFTIWGPAGTGKTFTIVHAINAILKKNPALKVLVCATTDLAVNHIAKLFMQTVPTRTLLRVFGKSVSPYDVYNSAFRCLLSVSHPVYPAPSIQDEFAHVSEAQIRSKNVTFVTTVSSSFLSESGVLFDYVFVDEAGQAMEAEVLIPTACSSPATSFILSGDPKQLGPVLMSPTSEVFGLSESVLEKYFPSLEDVLQTNNASSVVVLKTCYRCHPEIVDLLNWLFYRGCLKVALSKLSESHLSQQLPMLPNKEVPIVFIDVPHQQNEGENFQSAVEAWIACETMRTLISMGVPASEIGCVTPYTSQQQLILGKMPFCNALNIMNARVGRVDQFQGQELPVCIVSTVTSVTPRASGDFAESLPLLGDEKRTNVALSRARSLLVIIGCSQNVCADPLWGRLYHYLLMKGCVVTTA